MNNNYVDNYRELENMAYDIINLIQEVRTLRKRNDKLQKEVDMHNERIREKLQKDAEFMEDFLVSLIK